MNIYVMQVHGPWLTWSARCWQLIGIRKCGVFESQSQLWPARMDIPSLIQSWTDWGPALCTGSVPLTRPYNGFRSGFRCTITPLARNITKRPHLPATLPAFIGRLAGFSPQLTFRFLHFLEFRKSRIADPSKEPVLACLALSRCPTRNPIF